MDWRDGAACLGEDPELFFPIGTTGVGLRQVAQAKSVCRGCPVTGECLAWALDTGQLYGVWGGLSEDERLELRRRGYDVSRRIHLILDARRAPPSRTGDGVDYHTV
ncbi:MAG: WhiB family transcriptional regulator [Pseudonocardia sp.]|nr:WhiB family transcriptional regulator [Pseudonocardia sp.]